MLKSTDASLPNLPVGAAILVPIARQAQPTIVAIRKRNFPRSRYADRKLGRHRLASLRTVLTFLEDGTLSPVISDKCSSNWQP